MSHSNQTIASNMLPGPNMTQSTLEGRAVTTSSRTTPHAVEARASSVSDRRGRTNAQIALLSNASVGSGGLVFYQEDGRPRRKKRRGAEKSSTRRGHLQYVSEEIPLGNLGCFSFTTGQDMKLPDSNDNGDEPPKSPEITVNIEVVPPTEGEQPPSTTDELHIHAPFPVDRTIREVIFRFPELNGAETPPPTRGYPPSSLMLGGYESPTRDILESLDRRTGQNNQSSPSSSAMDPHLSNSPRLASFGNFDDIHQSPSRSLTGTAPHVVDASFDAHVPSGSDNDNHTSYPDTLVCPFGDARLFEGLSDALGDGAHVQKPPPPDWEHQCFLGSACTCSELALVDSVRPVESSHTLPAQYNARTGDFRRQTPKVFICACGMVVETHSNRTVGRYDPEATQQTRRCRGHNEAPSILSGLHADEPDNVDPPLEPLYPVYQSNHNGRKIGDASTSLRLDIPAPYSVSLPSCTSSSSSGSSASLWTPHTPSPSDIPNFPNIWNA
ncbi:hypothetical protein BD410DRAFT_794832 [Rickenella mellea]|uniref:Uncharacterized protein n=1 Tax=Rickenella mellea TaxID=50990 RepID=A0A4Y7PPH5_9AGAM|nr:hypothetical protein BD410DRAFT_794832 [Rickenella mellea]